MKGRPPKPIALHRLHGTYRDDRHGDAPDPPASVPDIPPHLDEEAVAEWHRITDELHRMGTLARVDRGLVAAYCQCWSHLVAAQKALAESGLVVKSSGGAPVVNPFFGVAMRCLKELRSYAAELGLSASSRARLRVEPAMAPDEFEDYMNGKGQFFVEKRVRYPALSAPEPDQQETEQ